jgi:hypothetical protein
MGTKNKQPPGRYESRATKKKVNARMRKARERSGHKKETLEEMKQEMGNRKIEKKIDGGN